MYWAPVLSLIPTAASGFVSAQDRIAATASTEIYLGVDNEFGPVSGTEITLFAQRESTVVGGLLSCLFSGVIDPEI